MKQTPENLVKREIKDWLDINRFFHFPIVQGLGCHPGVPDRIAMKNGVVLFIETKGPKGKLSEYQEVFHSYILEAECHYIVARGYEDIEKYWNIYGRCEPKKEDKEQSYE